MFVRLICKARRLEIRKLQLLKEKQDAFALSQKTEFHLSKKQKYRHFCHDLGKGIKRYLAPKFPKHSFPNRLCFNLRYNGTCENFVVKSIAGFLGGFILTYIFFMFFVLQLNFTLSTATIMCAIFGSILTIGLAYSYKVRCIVFLVLPQFFSKKGRQALLAYAYILAITGPAKNTLNNMSILGESLACGQEQLKAAVKQILEVIKKPFYAIRDAIQKVIATVKDIVRKIKEILLSIKRIIMSLVDIVKSAFKFIARVLNVCNSEFGTPYERCQKVFEDAILDCNAKLGPMFNWLCNITYLVKSVCYVAKGLDFLCGIVDFIKGTVTAIVTKVKQFIRHIRTMFYVRIKFSHSYHFESNHTKSMADITAGIVTEIKQRSSGLIKIFDFMSSAASIFFIFMVVKVIYYRHKFLTNEMFDNKFITKDFRLLDLRRAQLGLETILPLNHRERKLYISTSSIRLVKKEKSRLSQAAMILLMSTLKLSTHMATDYSLYWIMIKIRYYGRFQSKIDAPNIPGVSIEGEGFLAMLLKGIVKAFLPLGINLEIDTIPCLPDPIPPDYDRYIQIGSMLILCWFLAIFEPYGLRFRHSVMCFYHPNRARERTIWLYNHILRSRSSFLKFARRQLRRKVMSDESVTKITCMEFIRSRIAKCPCCVFIFGSGKQSYCLLCGEVYREGDKKIFIKCQTPNCPGLYCEQCYNDLQNLCTVCLDPITYGDLSDISEEKDSSEDEARMKRKSDEEVKKTKRKKKRRQQIKKSKPKEYDDDDDDDDQKKLLPYKKQIYDDSDYSSGPGMTGWDSQWSSDYDFEYQKYKDISRKSEDVTPRSHHMDLEKQDIPNLASMQDYHAEVLYDLDNMPGFDGEELDTSSIITDLHEGAMRSLNQSPDRYLYPFQLWMKDKCYAHNKSQRRVRRIKKSSTVSTSTKSASPIRSSSDDSKYDSVFEPEDIPLKRISLKKYLKYSETLDSSSYAKQSTVYPSKKDVHLLGDVKLLSSLPRSSTSREQMVNNQKVSMSKKEKDFINVVKSIENALSDSEDADDELSPLEANSSLNNTSADISSFEMTCKSTTFSPDNEIPCHPDVPKLDLKFLDSKRRINNWDCKCGKYSNSSRSDTIERCNCHHFKDLVNYNIINEYESTNRNTLSNISSIPYSEVNQNAISEVPLDNFETDSSSVISSYRRTFVSNTYHNNRDFYFDKYSESMASFNSVHREMGYSFDETPTSYLEPNSEDYAEPTSFSIDNNSYDLVENSDKETVGSCHDGRQSKFDKYSETSFNSTHRKMYHPLDETSTNYLESNSEDYTEPTISSIDNNSYDPVRSLDEETMLEVPRNKHQCGPSASAQESLLDKKEMYHERIRNYYRNLNMQQYRNESEYYDSVNESDELENCNPKTLRGLSNPLTRLLDVFRSKSVYNSKVKYRRCNINDDVKYE